MAGFHTHAQVNPSGYVGTGRGLAPYPALRPAQSATGPEEVTTGGADRTLPAVPPSVTPPPAAGKPASLRSVGLAPIPGGSPNTPGSPLEPAPVVQPGSPLQPVVQPGTPLQPAPVVGGGTPLHQVIGIGSQNIRELGALGVRL